MTDSVETLVLREAPFQQPLIMQMVVRRGLLEIRWGVGPLMAQVAHVTSAVLHETRERTETQAYLENPRICGRLSCKCWEGRWD
ncbi:hypothetical protein BD310DRAFT_888247 [Dichomitus squalens]|uniref:Uncharacterized protein n=1 Tax=Dichomitus squalens TaxID=114155 RepID=A0A4Q9PEL4_9APHY|nr:hypothetical protein BD310DRAFT_888247 [Dichomitus squalens]